MQDAIHQQPRGAVEACWAHNPEVRGSKPRSASYSFYTLLLRIEFASYFVEAKINIRKEGVTFYVNQNCLSQNSR